MSEEYFMEFDDPETGERMAVSVSVLFGRLWDEYIRDMIPNEYVRGMLGEMGLSDTEVFHMMERLQVGKAEYEAGDYREVSYC
jgi:hypothetical protein